MSLEVRHCEFQFKEDLTCIPRCWQPEIDSTSMKIGRVQKGTGSLVQALSLSQDRHCRAKGRLQLLSPQWLSREGAVKASVVLASWVLIA